MDTQCRPFSDDHALLFEEMSHRFANSLQLASSMIAMISRDKMVDDNLNRLATQLQHRLITLANLHRQLAMPVKADEDLSSTCRTLCIDLITAFGRNDAILSFDLQMPTVCPRISRTILLILAELITNAVKHGKTENELRISVAMRSNDGMCALRVCSADKAAGGIAATIERVASPRVAAHLVQGMGGLIEARQGPSFEVDVLLPAFAHRCALQADRLPVDVAPR